MGNLFNPDAPLMQGLSKVADMIILNLLTVICCIPLVTVGAAVTALYDATGRLVRDEGGVYRGYFRALARNFKQGTVIWLIVLATGLLLGYSLIFYVSNDMMALVVLAAVLVLMWAVTVAWVFPLQARFENNVKTTFKNALFCGIGYLPRSVVMSVINLLPWVLLIFWTNAFLQIGIVWFTVWFAVAAYLNMMILRKPFKKFAGEEDEDAEEPEEDEEYEED